MAPRTPKRESPKKQRLFSFLQELLNDSSNKSIVTWLNEQELTFQLIEPHHVARMWGAVTGNPTMTYDKMSRALRHFYESGRLEKLPGKDCRYKFLTPLKTLPKTPFTIDNILKNDQNSSGYSSLTSSPSSSTSGSTSTSPLQTRPPSKLPMANLMNAAQIAASAQNLLAEFNTLFANNPLYPSLSYQNQIQLFNVFITSKTSFSTLPVPN